MKELEEYYYNDQENIDSLWEDHIAFGEWGSGEDRITIDDDMFWEFVDELKFNEENRNEQR